MHDEMLGEKMSPHRRIMVFGFHSDMLTGVIKELRRRSVEVVYWVAGKHDFMSSVFNNKSVFPNTIFHNMNDAAVGIPAHEMDTSAFEPLSEEFIKRFFECELRSLTMMDSINHTGVLFAKKLHLYHHYLKYWRGVLTALRPDAILFNDAPHVSFKYVVYCLAKHFGIKQVILRNTKISGRVLIVDDIADYRKLRMAIEAQKGANFSFNDLNPDIRDHYEKKRHVDLSPLYFRTENVKERTHRLHRFLPSIRVLRKNIKARTLLRNTYLYAKMLFIKNEPLSLEKFMSPVWLIKLQERKFAKTKKEFKKEYTGRQINPDYSKKYIYVPLQRQPERSTLPDGGVFVDQILMIDILSHAIPSDWVIYVKENYMQWVLPRAHVGRFIGYTEKIIEKSNVFVVPAETGTFDLIKKTQAVATVTGTPAWEAVLRDKPALVFGNIWFMYCEGVFRVHDVESVKNALEKIQDGYKPNQQKIINFLKAVDETTIMGYRDVRFRGREDSNLVFIKNDKDNIERLTEGFYKALIE